MPGLTVIPPDRGYRAPPFREGFVSRPALVGHLRDARDARLALIIAPAGYGKSTLLAEWAACDERPFAWITLDSRDSDPVVLANSIGQAVEGVSDRRLAGDFVLVLDDAHAVSAPVLNTVAAKLANIMGSRLITNWKKAAGPQRFIAPCWISLPA